MESTSVMVAVRCRPLSPREQVESPTQCISTDSTSRTVQIGTRTFTFDQVFSIQNSQSAIFEYCVHPLLDSSLAGYNAAILAYGQTGSGKTFTMGSAMVQDVSEELKGIIPRVIESLVTEVEARKDTTAPVLRVSFLEIYNEEIRDLLVPNEKPITVREERGTIILPDLTEETVTTATELTSCLTRGSVNRVTASTQMNEQSSRSHAIFTINLEQMINESMVQSKFHFVDLAGSERIKRTGAVGSTLREGININLGLLSLGKVISALTEEGKKAGHVPYRESKLTRILQDSLGGNSKTCMIACVSPAEINFEETLNTLRYASNARKIKNTPVINRDPKSALILELRTEVERLKMELCSYTGSVYSPPIAQLPAQKHAQISSSPHVPATSEQVLPEHMNNVSILIAAEAGKIPGLPFDGLTLQELAASLVASIGRKNEDEAQGDQGSVQEEVVSVLERSVSEKEQLLYSLIESLSDMQKVQLSSKWRKAWH